MRKLVLTCLASVICLVSVHAQTLFTYGTHSVSKEDFLRVYNKNSINKQADMSDTALRSYLDLYSLFRMKVTEADQQHLDTLPSIQHELDNYRKQLAKNYLTDEQVTNKLVHEAYDRMKENVHIEHILIMCPPGADTDKAYAKIDSIYHVIIAKPSEFEPLAKLYSEDRGSKDNGGDIGYFTALQTVYPFENMAYTTQVGQVSMPFRTQFGYHIVKVLDKRADRGEVKVAQILIAAPKSKGEAGLAIALKRADSVEALLKSGVPFATLVTEYSDDKYSVNDSGIIKQFGAGRMVMPFENAAFALKNPGDVSEPVKTDYGYHIIKLIAKYPLQPYDTMYTTLKHKVENDSRAQNARDEFFNKIKEKNGFKEYPANVDAIEKKIASLPDTGKNGTPFKAADYAGMKEPVFTLGGKKYLQSDYAKFLENLTHGKLRGPKKVITKDGYNNYVTTVVNDFEEHKLVDENVDFKNLMEEYRDGIMLFELMDRNVWSKASKDTTGLKEFFATHSTKYQWEPGFKGAVYKFKNKAALDSGMALVAKKEFTDEEIAKGINTPSNPDAVTIQHGRYEFSHFKEATESELEKNKIKTISNANGSYTVVVAQEIYAAPGTKTLDEARGYVVAEYQDYLEKEWNKKMRAKYPLKVNEPVFKSMVKK